MAGRPATPIQTVKKTVRYDEATDKRVKSIAVKHNLKEAVALRMIVEKGSKRGL